MAADVSGLRRKALVRYGVVATESARALQAELRVRAPHRSYELRNAIEVTSRRSGPTTWTIRADAPVIQAATTNSGARPHIIRPRRAKVLAFRPSGSFGTVFARIVHHPGNRGTHWWDKVIARRSSIIAGVLRRF